MDVDASYQIGYPGLHKNGLIILNPNAYNSHLGVAQLTLGHELIHYRDWLGRGSAWSQQSNLTEHNAYSWEKSNLNRFIQPSLYRDMYQNNLSRHIADYERALGR